MLEKEINLNKKFIIILLFLTVITLGMYSSYAYYEVSVIKNSVIVLKTASIDITTTVVNQENNTFTIPKGSSITLTVNLTTELTNQIAYKMYYEVVSGISLFEVSSTTTFPNDIVEGDMTSSKSFSFTFTNTGQNDITIKLGTQGGLTGYPIPLEQGIELKLNETLGVPVKDAITTSVNNPTGSCKTKVEEDGITYISGTKICINFNYVWYSGKLWRITAINPDGTMKIITDDNITTISYNPQDDVNFYDISKKDDASYTGSDIYQWLNEDFLDTLYNYKNIIVEDSTWNITTSSSISTKLPETTLINNSTIGKNTPVGLLNSYEYYLSYKNTSNSSGYLNIGYYWWLLNPYSSSFVWNVNNNYGSGYGINSFVRFAARPSINLKSNTQLSGGSGTKDDPYTISRDKEQPTINTTLLNTRTIGEYVVFDEDGDTSTNELYRIVSIEDGKVKLNKNDYIKSGTTTLSKKFSTNTTYGSGTSDDYWDYYLNNTWYNSLASKDMLDKGAYYIKAMSSGSYKNSLCNTNNTTETTKDCVKTTSIWNTGYVGLPRYGEMFASQQGNGYNSSSSMWLITPCSSSTVWNVYSSDSGEYKYHPLNGFAARPSINLKSNIVITGGTGTKSNPFTIALKD
ncbi:MAG: hypothetical protein MR266_00600 [Erysipelotrichaceae bacterium]|nr:hypothetical protein [Erysipelotrichaceae bacterium]